MRIVAGLYRGRRILSPTGRTTRPITDRVKESLFAILGPDIAQVRVADLFAGTGSLGLEALSRRAEFCCFVENDRRALKLLKQNVQTLELDQQVKIATKSAWLFADRPATEGPFDLIFVDPPYVESRDSAPSSTLEKLLIGLSQPQLLSPGGTVVLRHEAAYPCQKNYASLTLTQSRHYGPMALSILKSSARPN